MRLVRSHINEAEEFTYFKGPSEEKIRKRLEGLSLEEKFKLALENNIPWLANDCLKKGLKLSDKYNNEIVLACIRGYLEILKILLKIKNLDPNIGNGEPIQWASDNGYLEIVKELMKDKRVNTSMDGNLALCWAKNENIARELLKDKRVRDKLTINQKIKYAKYLKQYDR
jgi:hypothetical protein